MSAKNINTHEDVAKGTLKKETPIEITKIKGMAKPLKKWYLEVVSGQPAVEVVADLYRTLDNVPPLQGQQQSR